MKMTKVFVAAGVLVFSAPALAQYFDSYQPNAYGLGTNADPYGQPFQWQQKNGGSVAPIFQDSVRPNAYGLGVGADVFGRPVVPKYRNNVNCIGTLKC